MPRKVHVNTASQEEKDNFKKRSPKYLWISAASATRQKIGFTVVSLDESFFFYDSLVRRVWIDEKKRPIVRITGSHKHSCIFGAVSMEGRSNYSDSMTNSTEIHFLII